MRLRGRVTSSFAHQCLVLCCVASVVFGFATRAHADGPLSANGSAIQTSSYSVDLSRSAFLGSTRMMGMGGASTAIAEGVEGGLQNPAAVAMRAPQWPDKLDYWLAFGLTYPLSSGDFFNSEQDDNTSDNLGEKNFVFFTPGAFFELNHFGFGVAIDAQLVKVEDVQTSPTTSDTVRLNFVTTHFQVGYGFLDGQLVFGAGMRLVSQRFLLGEDEFGKKDLFYRGLGAGFEGGAMYRPHDKRWRLGAAILPRVRTNTKLRGIAMEEADGDLVAGDTFLPGSTEIPWQGSVGFAYQFGKRPTNARWISVEEEAASDLAEIDRRERVLRKEYTAAVEKEKAVGGSDLEKRLASVKKSFGQIKDRLNEMRDYARHKAWQRIRNRFRNEWSRRFVLLSTDVAFTGKAKDAVGIESFLSQEVQRSGQKMTVSPRLGLETEIWPQHMKFRAGTYYEPSRFQDVKGRMHGTLGLDIRVLSWDVFKLWPEDYIWQIAMGFDIARDYQTMAISLGGWY